MKKQLLYFVFAAALFESVPAVYGEVTTNLIEKAEICLIEGKYREARGHFEAVIDSISATINQKAEAQSGIGEIQLVSKNYEKARQNFQKTINGYPGAGPVILATCRMKVAECFQSEKLFSRAIEEYYTALAYYPDVDLDFVSNCLVQIGECYYCSKKLVEAEEILKRVLKNYPGIDPSIRVKCQTLLAHVYRRQKRGLGSQFIIDNYQSAFSDYPSADLKALAAPYYKLCKYYARIKERRKSFETAVKGWIYSTPEYNRNIRTIWTIAGFFKHFDGDSKRSVRFMDYLIYGSGGEDGVIGTEDDICNPLPDFEKLTPGECRADRWPDGLSADGFPEPPEIKEWEDLLAYFRSCYRLTDDSDGTNTRKIGDYIIGCYKGIDGTNIRAREFFDKERAVSRGIKRAVTGKILDELERERRFVKMQRAVVRDFIHLEPIREMIVEAHTARKENDYIIRAAKAYRKKGFIDEARAAYCTLIEMPLADKEETVTRAVRGFLQISGNGREAGKVNDYLAEVIRGKMSSVNSKSDASIVLRGAIRALTDEGKENEAQALYRYCVSSYPDEEIAVIALKELSSSKELYEEIINGYPGTAIAELAAEKLIYYYAEEGNYGEAITLSVEYLRSHPRSDNRSPVLMKLADFYERAEDETPAITLLREAELRYRLGESHCEKGDVAGALTEFETLIKKYPESDFAPRALYRISTISGSGPEEKERRIRACHELVTCYPEDDRAFSALRQLRISADGYSSGNPPGFITAAVTGTGTEPVIIYSDFETAYESKEFGRAAEEGMKAYRRLVRRYAGLTGFSRRILTVCQLKKYILEEAKKNAGQNNTAGAHSSAAFLYEWMSFLTGESECSQEMLTEKEKQFLDAFMTVVIENADREISGELHARFTGSVFSDSADELTRRVMTYFLLTRAEKCVFDDLINMVGTGQDGKLFLTAAEYCDGIGRHGLALDLFEHTVKASRDSELLLLALTKEAGLYEKLKKTAEAIEVYERITRDFAGSNSACDAHMKIIKLYSRRWKAYDIAGDRCRVVIKEFPDTPEAIEAQFSLGHFAYFSQDYNSAIKDFELFIEKYPRDEKTEGARIMIALSFLGKQETGIALEKLREYVDDFPEGKNVDQAQYTIGYCHFLDQEYDKAMTEFQKIIDRYPDSTYRDKAKKLVRQMNELEF